MSADHAARADTLTRQVERIREALEMDHSFGQCGLSDCETCAALAALDALVGQAFISHGHAGFPEAEKDCHDCKRLSEAAHALAALRVRAAAADQLANALRPFADRWDLHAAPQHFDPPSKEWRAIPAHVIEEMIEDIATARVILFAFDAAAATPGDDT